jgi:peroxiredoxin
MGASLSRPERGRSLADMTEPLTPSVGWNVVHLFCAVTPLTEGAAIAAAVKSLEGDEHQVVPVALVGHKGDLCLMALGPDLWRLRRFQTEVADAGLDVVYSYVSLTEVSEYAQGMPDERKRPRLYPQLPPEGKPAFCFYPMSKRRGEGHNWYELPYDDRERLMMDHGKSGRNFAGRILQLITGSTGLDDYEWGVTLFGVHPDDLKACVYTMRYDEASARYAEFGPFVTGMVGALDEVLAAVGVRD